MKNHLESITNRAKELLNYKVSVAKIGETVAAAPGLIIANAAYQNLGRAIVNPIMAAGHTVDEFQRAAGYGQAHLLNDAVDLHASESSALGMLSERIPECNQLVDQMTNTDLFDGEFVSHTQSLVDQVRGQVIIHSGSPDPFTELGPELADFARQLNTSCSVDTVPEKLRATTDIFSAYVGDTQMPSINDLGRALEHQFTTAEGFAAGLRSMAHTAAYLVLFDQLMYFASIGLFKGKGVWGNDWSHTENKAKVARGLLDLVAVQVIEALTYLS